jgi:phospholipase A2
MDNNCPTYVLLHPAREADVIINMDASSDVQKDTFQERVDQIGGRRGMKFTKRHDVKAGEDPSDPGRFDGLYAQIYDGVPCERPATVVDSYGRTVTNPPAPVYSRECTMIYMPLLPNERVVPDFDPSTAKFSGSYNLVWTAEQVETLIKVCNANFNDGESTIREALHEAWLRKKALREGTYKGPAHTVPASATAQRPVDVSTEQQSTDSSLPVQPSVVPGTQQPVQLTAEQLSANQQSAGSISAPAAVNGQAARPQGVVGSADQMSSHPAHPTTS